jgi:hypothetical protein
LASLKGITNLEDVGINGRTILNCILKQQGGRAWTEFMWLRNRAGG